MNQEHTLDPGLKLTREELHSTTWLKISRHYEDRLARLREKNDGNLAPDATAKLRGQILEVKNLLALGNKD